jgi:hypothetical protein
MIKIIDGKRYNTATAECVASFSRGYAGDFDQYSEDLYLTKKGTWFLHGMGGPMTRWGEGDMQHGRGSGEGIAPLTPAEARAWLEHNDDVDVLEDHFSDAIEDA